NVFVQMMSRAVIAEVEPEYVAAELEQVCAQREDVQRLGAALPAMQQNDQIAGCGLTSGALARIVSEQAHAVAAIDDLFLRATQHRARPPREQRTAQSEAGQNRLQVRVGE